MFRQILTGGLIAGFAAGLLAAALHLAFLRPLLLQAELYEGGVLSHLGTSAGTVPDLPGFDLVRDGLSILFAALLYAGYGLLLVAGMALSPNKGAEIGVRRGLIWGVSGWAAVHMATAFGMPPDLPGSAGAELAARQIWWYCTAISTAAALWTITFGRGWAAWAGGIVLILVPQMVGLGLVRPDDFAGPAPPELASEFAARSLGVGLLAWAALGALAGHLRPRESA